ncbi:hydantoinase/oxoprolinase family protein [Streptomyces rugosispiralis]|uniref:Hydantoinase/oxoprolinase family protein n=1 Tax=Streptomyces rugosispiralis TaxID=2967341 RepID=A0ABT1URW4_9ACTN|nr:hydantoinase/oxoprolinase family protein [Streptomyces rugosispiralis]MCQ8187868.1 hydantoinase/oxoprolinase family protein [Streptomyces rugosispiralis]
MAYVIGIDIGGTFTDAFVADQHGRLAAAKTPSTPPDFADGFLNAIDELARELDIPAGRLLGETDYIVHGTTSTLNSLVTGDVARVGFLTTRGHADSISIMNLEGRYAGLGSDAIQHMARTAKPSALVPRHLIKEINERIDYKGAVVVPLDEDGVRQAVRDLLADGAEAIAVSLLWSFRNAAHERRIRELIHAEAPGLYVALSSEVSPRIREYSRSVTTIMNTQVGPRLDAYLRPLQATLRERGLTGSLLVMQGSGGCVSADNAPAHAVTTIGSVLSGGVIGCTRMAEALHSGNVISTDMGGTTFLVGLVVDGAPARTSNTVLNQYTISTPMVDVHTIGAGGGAIAWVDPGGNLRVGPRSAGARPGPACYGEGGVEPTVTDADLVLGIINPDNFLGGRKKLDVTLARKTIAERLAKPLGLSVDEAAAAVYEIQNAQTADLVRKVVVNSGQDPRDFSLYAFGGAGPMHCASYARDLGARQVIVPIGATAAVFSAYGLATSDIVLTAERSQPAEMPVDPARLTEAFESLETELATRLAEQGLTFQTVHYEREADLRYTMQLAEVSTLVPNGSLDAAAVAGVGAEFQRRYDELYGEGTGFPDAGLQLITCRVRATGTLAVRPELPDHLPGDGTPIPSGTRNVLLDITVGVQPTAIYDYQALGAGHQISGPAIVEAPTTTVALPPGTHGVVDRLGNLVLTFAPAGSSGLARAGSATSGASEKESV